jgi:hypothetical protein
MDTTSYEQIELGEDFVGDRSTFLQDGMMVQVQLHGDRPIGIKLPETVVLEVVEADAHIKGQTATSSYKSAKLENGLRVLVPPFISTGEKIVGLDRRGRLREAGGIMQHSALLNVMIAAARKAARTLKRDFGEVENLQVSLKGPGNFVTAADRKAEETLKAELAKARPGYGFLGEESGSHAGTDTTHTWIVDPLDGTTNFLHGIPQFAISIGLERSGTYRGRRDLQSDH